MPEETGPSPLRQSQPSAIRTLRATRSSPAPPEAARRTVGPPSEASFTATWTSPALATGDIVQGPLLGGHPRTVAFVARDTVWGVF